MDTLIQS